MAETIHSGHFMVSHFEAEAQDDEDGPGLAVPEPEPPPPIENSLNKLFQCMTLAYRQKLTSPKWNRFKGVKLRWKDKIRLNNVIWRCWHMQFILKQNNQVCQFASPLDVDTHIKAEATILEGKYWKRRAGAVIAEYKKWRMYYRNQIFGCGLQDVSDVISDMDVLDWAQGDNSHMLVDEDYVSFMSDTLFSTITNNQPFAFPDTREIARGAGLADFIQPSLGPLQPNLEDFMDTLEPLQEMLNSNKLPPVPEEIVALEEYRSLPMLTPNFQQPLEQAPQYPMSQMTTTRLQLDATQYQQPSVNQTTQMQPLNHNSIGKNQPTIVARHEQLSQQHSQNSQMSLNQSVVAQNQAQPIMLQQFGLMNSDMLSHQAITHSGTIITQQAVAPASQEPQKSHQYIKQQQIYQQIPINAYHSDRNYGSINQVMHQSRADSNSFPGSSRRTSNRGGCIRERISRQRLSPFVPPVPNSYTQFNSSPTTTNAPQSFKSDKQFQNQEHNIITSSIPQNINLTTGIYLSNVNVQSVDQNIARFKMPSPPPQKTNTTLLPLPQLPSNQNTNQPQTNKGESFRSNSLPIGASLGTILGTNTRVRRRPRSGSSSPAPIRRAPLNTTASEPVLKPASVLLAHLLTSNSQDMYKSNTVQSLSAENINTISQQIQPLTILPVPANTIIMPSIAPTSPQVSYIIIRPPVTPIYSLLQLNTNMSHNSPPAAPSPQSPSSPLEGSSGSGKEHKRAGHIHAEQKRRYNIKNGFDVLQYLIPQLSQNPTAKVSKAAMLQKGAEYIKQLQSEVGQVQDEMGQLKQQIEFLNNSISNCQSLLPATGAPISRQKSGKLQEMFDEYVCQRTNENWKFWIFSLIIEPLLTSYNNCVSPASTDELKRSTLLWAEQHCSLVEMRPAILNSLRQLYTTTDILSDPKKLPDQARTAANKKLGENSKKAK